MYGCLEVSSLWQWKGRKQRRWLAECPGDRYQGLCLHRYPEMKGSTSTGQNFQHPPRPLVWSFPVSLVPMSSELRTGQSRAHLAVVPSPPLARPTPAQASLSSWGPAPLSSGQRPPLLKPKVCSGLSPLEPVESSWDSRGQGWGDPWGHAGHQAGQPQLSPDWGPALALCLPLTGYLLASAGLPLGSPFLAPRRCPARREKAWVSSQASLF